MSISSPARKHISAALMVAVLLVPLLPGVALAGTEGTACDTDTTRVLLWENIIGDSSDNNDNYWKCDSDGDLNSGDPHNLPGDCHSGPANSTNWNDCASSVSVWLPSGWCIDFYVNANYNTSMNNTVQGPSSGTRFNLASNDQLSSFRFYTC